MKAIAICVALLTIFAIGYGVDYALQSSAVYVILKNIFIFYCIGGIIIEGLVESGILPKAKKENDKQ